MSSRTTARLGALAVAVAVGCGGAQGASEDGASGGAGGKADDADGQQGSLRPDDNPYADLDPDFERLWKDDMAAELAELVLTGKAHSDDAKARAELHDRWFQDYLSLGDRQTADDDLSSSEEDRLEAYQRVFDSMPARDNQGWAARAVHQKNHGCFAASFRTVDGIPQRLQKGLFVPGQDFNAIVRFSNGAPRYVHDFDPSSHGMAVKLLPKEIEFESSSAEINGSTVLNISNVDFPVAFMFDPVQYRKTIVLTSPDFDDVDEDLGYDLSQLRVAVEALLLGNDTQTIDLRTAMLALGVNGKIIHNPLFQRYNSMSVFRLGEQDDPDKTAVKYILEPCEAEMERRDDLGTDAWADWTRKPHFKLPGVLGLLPDISVPFFVRRKLKRRPDYLGEHARQTLDSGDFCFQLLAQPFVDEANTPVEDPTVMWLTSQDEREHWDFLAGLIPDSIIEPTPVDFDRREVSEPIKIAELTLQRTEVDSLTCEDLSFSVWDNVPNAHKPLGIANRMRWFAYRASLENRTEINQTP